MSEEIDKAKGYALQVLLIERQRLSAEEDKLRPIFNKTENKLHKDYIGGEIDEIGRNIWRLDTIMGEFLND